MLGLVLAILDNDCGIVLVVGQREAPVVCFQTIDKHVQEFLRSHDTAFVVCDSPWSDQCQHYSAVMAPKLSAGK